MNPVALSTMTWICGVIVSLSFFPALFLLGQVLSAVRGGRFATRCGETGRQAPSLRLALLVPAHDEVLGIAATLATLLPQIGPADRCLVVADNCSDGTAAAARAAGAEVVERVDAVRRGKGYALDFGLRHLAADPPDVVLMFDADCQARAGCVALLAQDAERHRRPIQALYIIRAVNHGMRARISEFAYRLRNWARPLGMLRFDGPCHLMGCGMGFHWSVLQGVDIASGHLAEDLQLGIDLAKLGRAPRFCPDAVVDSLSVADAVGAVVQRTRWEHGHLSMLVSQFPRLIAAAVARRDGRLLAMAFDLAVPPLALLASIITVSGMASAGLALWGGSSWPLMVALAAAGMLVAAVVLTQRVFARELIQLRELFWSVPLYLLRKVPMYAQFLFRRQVEWVRTKRDA